MRAPSICTRGLRLPGLCLAAAAVCAPAASAQTYLTATMDGAQVTPPTGSTATGSCSFVLDAGAGTLRFYVSFTGLQGTQTSAHIHGFAPPGTSAGILFNLPLGNPVSGTLPVNPGQVAGFLSNLGYCDIHSTAFPSGEIRGQIVVAPSRYYLTASPDGAQEVPPTASTATGFGSFLLDAAAGTLSFHSEYSGLLGSETFVHIHGFAPPGANANVLFDLPLGNPIHGTITVTPGQSQRFIAGLGYINYHTTLYPTGEIRGQIVETPAMVAFCTPGVDAVACPCANPPSGAGRGCDNHGDFSGGAALAGSGSPSLASDTLTLAATGENGTELTVFFQGQADLSPGIPHGAGVRCVSNTLKRLYTGNATGGGITRPGPGDPSVHAASTSAGDPIGPSERRYYFTIYRDPGAVSPCGQTSSTINLSNAVEILWFP